MEELSIKLFFLLGLSLSLYAFGSGVFPIYFRVPLFISLLGMFLPVSLRDLEQLSAAEVFTKSSSIEGIYAVSNNLILQNLFKGVALGFLLSISSYIAITFSFWMSAIYFGKGSSLMLLNSSFSSDKHPTSRSIHLLILLLFSYALISSDFVFFLYENAFYVMEIRHLKFDNYNFALKAISSIFVFSFVLLLPFVLLSLGSDIFISLLERYSSSTFDKTFLKGLKISLLVFSVSFLMPSLMNAFLYLIQTFSSRDFLEIFFGIFL